MSKRLYADYRSVVELPVSSPELYVKMLHETYQVSDDGQLYTTHADRRKFRNACKVSGYIINDEVWDCICVAFIEPNPQPPSYWRRLVQEHADRYADTKIVPAWNQRAEEAGQEPNWRLGGWIGWRTSDHALFHPRPGLHVVIR